MSIYSHWPQCASEGVLWVTQRMTFRKTLAAQSMQDTFDRVEFLKKVSILKDLDQTQLNSLSGALMEQRFPKDSNIVTEVREAYESNKFCAGNAIH